MGEENIRQGAGGEGASRIQRSWKACLLQEKKRRELRNNGKVSRKLKRDRSDWRKKKR